jgi:hypothetical protein
MNQALYAHMNKRKMKKKFVFKEIRRCQQKTRDNRKKE